MASLFEISSMYRDRIVNPLPTDFTLPAEQTRTWFRSSRSVRAYPANPLSSVQEFVTSIDLRQVITPYSDTIASIPRLYVDFHGQTNNDQFLIQFPFGFNRDAKFSLYQDKVQNNSSGDPVWIIWKSVYYEQVMRIKRDDPITVRIFTQNGMTLPISDAVPPLPFDPNQQVLLSFDMRPYVKDAEFDNHLQGISVGAQ